MPPPFTSAGCSRLSNSISSNPYTQMPIAFLLVLVVATGIRFTVLFCTRRKRESPTSYQHLPEKNESSLCRAAQEEKHPATYNLIQEEKESTSFQAPLEGDSEQDQCPRSNEQLQHTFLSIYPWTSPPQPLPGPYDPPYYPLPTIRRHSYDPFHETSPDVVPQTTMYTRQVSTDSLHATHKGTMTTTSNGPKGWRRNQWVVSG